MSNEDIKVINKIKQLERMKALCMVFTIIIAFITIIDIFVPDPVLLLDEAALASITGLFTFFTAYIDSKINDLRNGNKLRISNEEIGELTSAIGSTANTIKKSRNK